ncbi:MAG TPA: CYCXC family (seleno)protein [Terriglobia bacterium]|nr:CYCXC family (seleno)protein [Terriglobia bacterium]
MKSNKKKKKSKSNLWLGIGAVAFLAIIGWYALGGSDGTSLPAGLKLVATMSPSYFSNDAKAQAAYQTAKDIPEVLAELPCFCGCMQNFGHENNLFCFRDEHGSGCSMCEDIALDARDMHKQGLSVDRIKEAIRARYGRSSQ